MRICDPEPIRKGRKLKRVSSTVVDVKNEVVFSSVNHEDRLDDIELNGNVTANITAEKPILDESRHFK